MHTSALVLFSGGQDSTTCLALALSKYQRVETLAFDYRQRHRVELTARLEVLGHKRFLIETPLMWIDKADTWALAHSLGGQPLLDVIVEHTHTCYLGDRTHRHAWGYGCGQCPACELRARGYQRYLERTGTGTLPGESAI